MIYRFDTISVDTRQYRVENDGRPVAVEPLVFDLLVYLIERRDQVVTRDELLDALWPGKVVTDAALGVRVGELRKSIDDSGSLQRWIKTVQGRGYQFIGKVEDCDAESGSEINHLFGPAVTTPTIAILPFSNLSGNKQHDYLADGLTEEIISSLSRVPKLAVIARNSSYVYKDKVGDARQIGADLDAQFLLEGSIRISGERMRVTAQLVETTHGENRWTESYDRTIEDLFAVQEDIARRIVIELQVKLVTGLESRLRARGTASLDAWKLVLQAGPLVESHVRENALEARRLLQRALDIDPDYAAAWVLLGWIHWEDAAWHWGEDAQQSMAESRTAADRSIAADPEYPDAYSLLGAIYRLQNDSANSIKMSLKAFELAPSDAGVIALLGIAYIRAGQNATGVRMLRRSLRLSPYPPHWMTYSLGMGLHLLGDNAAAVDMLQRAIEQQPDSYPPYVWLALALHDSGQAEAARKQVQTVLAIEPNFSVGAFRASQSIEVFDRTCDRLREIGFPG